nr:class I SAM-dependent methyltransferase [Thiohalomonas denitrificans]
MFVPPAYHVSAKQEKGQYDLHENFPEDPGYRRFLNRLYESMQALLEPDSSGLDFGCGPGPTLSLMFEETGHRMAIFDTFYRPDTSVFAERYDFITATEVVEHLHRPGFELERLWECLKPGGRLGLMTKQVQDREAFAGWHYKNDITHVCFFSRQTFQWLADRWGARLEFHGSDVILLTKPE